MFLKDCNQIVEVLELFSYVFHAFLDASRRALPDLCESLGELFNFVFWEFILDIIPLQCFFGFI